MKKFICLLGLVVSFGFLFSQGKMEEVVYLKNGSIIHGMIVELVPNVSIKIKSGENLFAYKLDEIEKITWEESTASKNGFGYKDHGYVGIAEVGLTDFPAGGNLAMASIDIINGYQVNPYFYLGLGIGADISTKKIYNVPVFADARINFTKTRVSPFLELPIGYNLQLQDFVADPYYGGSSSLYKFNGMVFNPALGLRVAINKKYAASLSLGYKLLGVKVAYSIDYGYGYTESVSQFTLAHGITLKAGFNF